LPAKEPVFGEEGPLIKEWPSVKGESSSFISSGS